MYQNYFGFKEKPFRLVPNPAYLFLSRSHEEALAHLTYAVTQGDGFVEITGEVGTGKTTLCRAFLENLNDHTDAAYIFNPKLDPVQLLKTINEEFGIPSAADTTKDLTDALNAFLIAEKTKGKNLVLLIDEAHNLSIDVLEQIRLLSNLETTRSKLLQIILVGQPELEQTLSSPKIRQLGQRISLSCSLEPLTCTETRDYIQHRLNVASRKPGIKFPLSAVRAIYTYSKGIPRLINIACDRTLLLAFSTNQERITGKTAKSAIRELTGKHRVQGTRLLEGNRGILVFSALCLTLLLAVLYPPDVLNFLNAPENNSPSPNIFRPIPKQGLTASASDTSSEKEPPAPTASENRTADAAEAQPEAQAGAEATEPFVLSGSAEHETGRQPDNPATAESAAIVVQNLGAWLKENRLETTRQDALTAALDLWKVQSTPRPHLDAIQDTAAFFRLAAQHNGFYTYSAKGDLELIRKINLPAILEFFIPNDLSLAYLTVSTMKDQTVLLRYGSTNPIAVSLQELKIFWTGTAFVPWKNFLGCMGEIPTYAPEDSVVTLKMMLKDIGFQDIGLDPIYDPATQEAVRTIQVKHGIPPDGVVGSLTKIILYNEHGAFDIPHIRTDKREQP